MPSEISVGQPFSISVDVKNTGSRAGEEVVQLYMTAPREKVWMPKKELRGFRRISLAAGETKTVTFHLCADDFYYWSQTSRKYDVQTGNYIFRVGGASDNLPLSQQITFKSGTGKPDLRITRVYTMPRYPIEGQKVSFYALVKNQGNAATTSTTPYAISFSVGGKNVAATAETKTVIAPGQVQLIASEGEWVSKPVGKASLGAQLAFSNTSVEWDSDNNSYVGDMEVFDSSVVSAQYKNLAYLKDVTVSSEAGKYFGNQLVDGDLSTRWDSENGAAESAVVDLAAICEADKVQLFWDTDYAKQYVLERSMDGMNWIELKSATNSVGGAEYHNFEKFNLRYLRIRFIERKSGSNKFSLREIQVLGSEKEKMPSAKVILGEKTVLLPHAKTYVDATASENSMTGKLTYQWTQISGPEQALIASPALSLTELEFKTVGTYLMRLLVSNGVNTAFKDFSVAVVNPSEANDLAFKKPTSASSSEKVNMYPQAAVDGSDNTRWSSAHKNGEWWQVDLQHQVKPSQISILWHNEYAKKFNIQISPDGNTWNTYATNDSFAGGTSKSDNDGNVSGRYVRVNCVERSGQWENSIKTFNLYGDFVTNTNHLPTAKARCYKQDSRYFLDAQESADVDGDKLTYVWSQLTGPAFVGIENPNTSLASLSGLQPGSYFFKVTVDDGKDIDFKIVHVDVEENASSITPIALNRSSDRLQVFPNPARDHIFIRINDATNASIKILDMNGREIIRQNYTENSPVNLIANGPLKSGVYFVKAIEQTGVMVKKIIVN
jgi:hypothetical protein